MVEARRATGATLAQIGRELDVRPDQLRAWVRLQREAQGGGSGMPGETLEQENRRLRRENATLRQEQAFAKKRVLHDFPGNAARIFRKKYSSSLNPYAIRLITLIRLLMPSNRLVWSGYLQ